MKNNFMQKKTVKRICKVCKCLFYITKNNADRGRGKFCSNKCNGEAQKKGKEIKCYTCGKDFYIKKYALDRSGENFCSHECSALKKQKDKKTSATSLFRYANTKFRKKFLEKHDYFMCEHCGVSSSPRFETHHIIFRSELGKKHDMHNEKNLLMLCIKCHNLFHTHKNLRNKYVTKRKLNELYGRNFIIQDKNF